MRMFRRRAQNDYDRNDYDGNAYDGTRDGDGTAATPAAGIRRAYGDSPAATTARGRTTETTETTTAMDDGRRWHHGPTRALVTLLAAGLAGLLAWTTTNINDKTTGGYWAVYGILAGAGLVMALSQVIGGWTKRGRPTFSPTVFLLAFVPTAIAVLWIVVFHQPHTGLWRGHVTNWSGNLGIAGFVRDMGGDLLTMLSFGLGLVFGFCFDTTGALRPTTAPAPASARRAPVDRTAANEPIAREREQDTVRS